MSPELKAFIASIADCPADDLRDTNESAHQVPPRLALNAKVLLATIADSVAEIGPFTCELCPMRTVQSAIAQYCAHRDAIGYHGLA